MNFRAGSTFPVPVFTVPSSMDWTSRCNNVDAVWHYASYRLNLLLLKMQRCVHWLNNHLSNFGHFYIFVWYCKLHFLQNHFRPRSLKLERYSCSKHLLHNSFSKRIYPGTVRSISNSINMATIPWLINATSQGAISLAIDVNTDTSNQGTFSARIF